jgi:hypothetical protein
MCAGGGIPHLPTPAHLTTHASVFLSHTLVYTQTEARPDGEPVGAEEDSCAKQLFQYVRPGSARAARAARSSAGKGGTNVGSFISVVSTFQYSMSVLYISPRAQQTLVHSVEGKGSVKTGQNTWSKTILT